MAVQPASNASNGHKASSGPTQYLRDFIAETDPTGTPPEVALKNKHARASAAKKLADIENDRVARGEAAAARNANQAARASERAANREAAHTENVVEEAVGAVTASAEKVGGSIAGSVGSGKEWLASLPTPGSIALLLAVILFFVWAVVPVGQNGETRLQLLWLTLTGKTSIVGEQSNSVANMSPTSSITSPTATPSVTTLSAGGIASTGVVQTPIPSQTQLLSSTAQNAQGPVVNPNTGYTPDFGTF